MSDLIKIHHGLFLYLCAELKKKKNVKEVAVFLLETGKKYVKVMTSEVKKITLLFNADYRKQKASFDKVESLKKDLNRALKLLQHIDEKMNKSGVDRTSRRAFWRDFFKSGQVRTDIFNELLKEVK